MPRISSILVLENSRNYSQNDLFSKYLETAKPSEILTDRDGINILQLYFFMNYQRVLKIVIVVLSHL